MNVPSLSRTRGRTVPGRWAGPGFYWPLVEVAQKFHDFADLLLNKVAPELAAARADWAEQHPEHHPQG